MSNGTTIQLRIDASTKSKARKVLKDMGLDLSSAIKLFLTQLVYSSPVSFEIRTPDGFTPAKKRELLREAAWAKKHGKRYASARAMLDDILSS